MWLHLLSRQTPFKHLLGNKANLNLTSKSAHRLFECPLTLNPPSRSNVGSRPTEKIRRSIVEAMSARMPWGWGKTMTIARETSMAIHSRADRWGSRVPEDEGHIKKSCEHFHSWSKFLQQKISQWFHSRHGPVVLALYKQSYVSACVCVCVGFYTTVMYSTSSIVGQQSIIMCTPGAHSVPTPDQRVVERLHHIVNVNQIPQPGFLFTDAPTTPF